MSENAKKEQVKGKNWFQGMSAEFKKIVWPTKKDIAKNTVAVVITSVILGLIISGIDILAGMGVQLLGKLQKEKGDYMSEANWYVVHTYSGYENKVKANIDKTIENRHLEDQILEVRVPLQEVVELRNGAKKQVQKKMFPGYVLINMVMNDDTWYVVRNTRGVTGFVGPGSKPVPLTEEEMRPLGIKSDKVEVDFAEGDTVIVTGGVWADTVGVVQAMNQGKQSLTINVDLFGRETPVEISFADVKKM